MTTNRNYDYLIKLLLIGDSGTDPPLPPFLVLRPWPCADCDA